MDGVIVNNHEFHLKAWELFCCKHNYPFNMGTFSQKYFGKSNHEILTSISQIHYSKQETFKLGEEKELIYRDLYFNEVKSLEGLEYLLEQLKISGKLIAVASSAPLSNINFVIDTLNIRKYFNVIVDASMVEISKPNPDIYLKTAHLLGIKPLECLVFEDSHSGIRAALDAGMNVVAVATTHTKDELVYDLRKISDFRELFPDKYTM